MTILIQHPTNENTKYWIKPQTGMILLFQQKEMYSKELIDDSKKENNQTLNNSYEVEKQTVYFQRKQSPAIKSSVHQPNPNGKKSKINKLYEPSLTLKVIDFWFIEAFETNNDKRIFPLELLEEIAKYCRIIDV